MSDWRPFEPSREAVDAAQAERNSNRCNRHGDCSAADARAKKEGRRWGADHCHDSCCEECFGS